MFLPGEIEWRIEVDRRKNRAPLSVKSVAELNELAVMIGADPLA